MSQGIGLTSSEICSVFEDETLRSAYPPILSPSACAAMLGMSVNTLYAWLEAGQLLGAHRRRGKRQFIWRDRILCLTFNGSLAERRTSLCLDLGGGIGLTDEEINQSFATHGPAKRLGPILTADQMADLLSLSRSTLYFWIAQGHFARAARKQGKRQLFWRNRAVQAIFNDPHWE